MGEARRRRDAGPIPAHMGVRRKRVLTPWLFVALIAVALLAAWLSPARAGPSAGSAPKKGSLMFPHLALLVTASVALVACAAPALAAETAPAWGEWLKPWWDMLTQGLIAGVLMLVAGGARRWLGISLEERHRQALHMALTTGADAAWAKLMNWTGQGLSRAEIEQRLLTETIAHAQAGAADAIKAFALDDADPRLVNLALAKLKQTAPLGADAFSLPPVPAAAA